MGFRSYQDTLNTNPNTQPQEPVGKRQAGTGFTNISKVLGANVGAGTAMGKQIGESVGQQAGKIQEDVSATAQKFKTQAEQAKQQALGTVAGGMPYTNITGGNVPTDISNMTDEQAREYYKNLQNLTYKGPMGLSNVGALQGQAAGLSNIAKATSGGVTGQSNLLRSMMGGATPYTRGQSILDASLLGQSQQAQQAIKSAGQKAAATSQDILSQTNIAQNIGQQAQQNVEAQKENIQKGLTSSIGDITATGQQSAKEYMDKAARVKELLTGLDQYNNPIQVSQSDLDLINNLGQFGIDTGMKFDTGVGKDLQTGKSQYMTDILNELANKGSATYASSMQNFTPQQQETMRKLYLMTGQEDLAKKLQNTSFNKDIFHTPASALEKMKGYTDLMGKEASNTDLYNRINESLKNYQNMFTAKDYDLTDPNYGYNPAIRGAFVNSAKDILGKDVVDQIRNKYYSMSNPNGIENQPGWQERGYLNEVQGLLAQKKFQAGQDVSSAKYKETIGDYLKRLYTPKTKATEGIALPSTRPPLTQV